MAIIPKFAALDQVLLWYDGPQIVLLKADDFRYILAVAADEDERDDLFFGALFNLRQLAAYQAEQYDLRYLLTHPSSRAWFTFSLDTEDTAAINLLKIKKDSPLIRKYLPDSGFFSRAHEEIRAAVKARPSSTERFDIDGTWDLGEFSNLYGQIEDIYYIFNSLDRHADPATDQRTRERVQDALLRPFMGGGSYLGLYRDFANDNDPASKLRVSGIQYNSPGYVEVKARQKPFGDLLDLLNALSDKPGLARQKYRNLYQLLAKSKLLRAAAGTYIVPDLVRSIEEMSKSLALSLNGLSYHEVYAMSRQNALITAKVLLSVHRRAERLYAFFEQGRVKHPNLDADPLDDI